MKSLLLSLAMLSGPQLLLVASFAILIGVCAAFICEYRANKDYDGEEL